MFDVVEKREIAGRSRTLFERLEGPANEPGGEPFIDVSDFIEEWEETLQVSENGLEPRLRRADTSLEAVTDAASATRWPADEPLPEWIETLEFLVHSVTATTENRRKEFDEKYNERPFSELLTVLVTSARRKLANDERASLQRINDTAITNIADWLHQRLAELSTRLLYIEFKTFIARFDKGLVQSDPEEFEEYPDEKYELFLDELFDDGFKDLCKGYPLYARMLSHIVDNWVDAFVELFNRLKTDRELLCKEFGFPDPEATVVDLQVLADDTHAKGRAVVRLEFENDKNLVYKPRHIDGEVAYYSVVKGLNDMMEVPDIYSPTLVPRDGYGWMEFLEYKSCQNMGGVREYYQRVGVSLCLSYVLNLNDGIFENVITHGSHPVLLDLETILEPGIDPSDREMAFHGSAREIEESVVGSNLLPWGVKSTVEQSEDVRKTIVAGFAASPEPGIYTSQEIPVVKAKNTDVMSIDYTYPEIRREENVPKVNGEHQLPSEFIGDILEGFEECYDTIQSISDDGSVESLLEYLDFTGLNLRVLYRPTQRYIDIITSLKSHEVLVDGVKLSANTEKLLTQFFKNGGRMSSYYGLYERECESIINNEPPRFVNTSDEKSIRYLGDRPGVQVKKTGLEKANERIDGFSDSDKRAQMKLIRECFERRPGNGPGLSGETASINTTNSGSISDQYLLDCAVELFDYLIKESQINTSRDNEENEEEWWILELNHGRSGVTVSVANHGLSNGKPGIALGSGAIFHTTNNEKYKRIARSQILDSVEQLLSLEEPVEKSGRVITSTAYSCAVLSELIDDSTLQESAAKLVEKLPASWPENIEKPGINNGLAGAIIELLGCYSRCGNGTALSRAKTTGKILSATQDSVTQCGNLDRHVAGSVYALARLGDTTGESQFLETAEDLLEQTASTTSKGPLSQSGQSITIDHLSESIENSCDGEASSRLLLLAASQYSDNLKIKSDVGITEFYRTRAGSNTYDHLCCGNFSEIELLYLWSQLEDKEPKEARCLASDVLCERDEITNISLVGDSTGLMNTALFTGATGIVYTLLRISDRKSIPSLLLRE